MIADLFERITLYDLKADTVTTRQTPDGRWETTLTVTARKLYADGEGTETPATLDEEFEVGVFSAEPGKKEFTRQSVLAFERHRLRDGSQKIVVQTNAKPA